VAKRRKKQAFQEKRAAKIRRNAFQNIFFLLGRDTVLLTGYLAVLLLCDWALGLLEARLAPAGLNWKYKFMRDGMSVIAIGGGGVVFLLDVIYGCRKVWIRAFGPLQVERDAL
jgi:hypothetical protein